MKISTQLECRMVAPPAVLKITDKAGFTLVEMSIVMVIIGLLIGGVLVGRDLISTAGVRAQISQIEKYQTAVNTFRSKYNCLPGDCPQASSFGFTGDGDGNGKLANVNNGGDNWLFCGACGSCSGCYATPGAENFNFWYHLSQAGMLDQGPIACCHDIDTDMANYVKMAPEAKMTGSVIAGFVSAGSNGMREIGNALILSAIKPNGGGGNGLAGIMNASEASKIDEKVDDGMPTSGKVVVPYYGACTRAICTDLRGAACTSFTTNPPSQYVKNCTTTPMGLIFGL